MQPITLRKALPQGALCLAALGIRGSAMVVAYQAQTRTAR